MANSREEKEQNRLLEENSFEDNGAVHNKFMLVLMAVSVLVAILLFVRFYTSSKNTAFIDGNILNLAYLDSDSASEGRISFPLTNQPLYITLMYRSLFTTDSEFENIEMDLASSYSVSDDGLTYEITMGDGNIWSDYEMITVDDVVFTIEAALLASDVNRNYSYVFSHIKGADEFVADPSVGLAGLEQNGNTLTITLDKSCGSMLQNLAQISIIPSHIFEDVDMSELSSHQYWKTPVVSGMYCLDYFLEGEYYKLIHNIAYGNTKPSIDQIVLHIDYEISELDFYTTSDLGENIELSRLSGFDGYDVDMLFYRYFIFNISSDYSVTAPMDNPNVREAIACAIDRETILYNIYFNTGMLINSGEPFFQHDNPNQVYVYNPERSKELLEDVGYDFDQVLCIGHYYTDGISNYFIESMAEYLEKVGFEVMLFSPSSAQGVEFDENVQDASELVGFYDTGVYDDYLSNSPLFFNAYGEAGEFDDFIELLFADVDPETQDEMLAEINALERETMYKLPLFTLSQTLYINTNRVNIPSEVEFGNTWYRYDVNFENWSIKHR